MFSFSQCRWARAKKLMLLQHRVQHRILGQRSTFLSSRSFSFDNKSLCWNWCSLDYIWSDIRFISSFPVLISFTTTEASLLLQLQLKLKLPLLNTDCSLHEYFTIIKLLIIFSPLHFFSCVTNCLCWHEEEVGYLSAMLYSGQHYLVGRCFLIVLWLCIMKILEYLIWHNLQAGLVIY